MLRFLISLIFLSSCTLGVTKKGGEKKFLYNHRTDYQLEELKTLAPHVVSTMNREPPHGKYEEIFDKKMGALKRVGILIFETRIQPTLDGLAKEDKIYLSEQGKQLITEKFLTIWNQSFPIVAPAVDYVRISDIKKSNKLHAYGLPVDDYIKSNRNTIDPDDIFFRPKGKRTTSVTTVNPRGMQDLSFVLVPAYELMRGPKFSEHNKQFVNAVTKELNLDAAIIVFSEINWTASRVDKYSGDAIPEEMTLKLSSSILLPVYAYDERLKKSGEKQIIADVTLAYKAYESTLTVPIKLSEIQSDKAYQAIEQEILNPMLKTYKDQAQMVISRMADDLKLTY